VASINKRGNFFRVRVRRAGFPAQCKTFDTPEEARKWADELERDFDSGLNDDYANRKSELTLHAALEKYAKECTPKKSGVKQELRRIRAWQKHKVAPLKLSQLRPVHFRKFIAAREAAGITGSTLISDLAVISNIFDMAKTDWGFGYLENPLDLVRRPKPNGPRERRLTDDEQNVAGKAFAAYPNPWVALTRDWATHTAMRKGEIHKLLERDIDLGRRTVTVRAKIAKNRESRVIGLSKGALQVLARRPAKSDPHAFPVSDSTIARAMKRVRDTTGIGDYEFRDTRREATSRLAERGFSALEMQKVTGHKTLQLLQDYTRLDVKHVLARLDSTELSAPVPTPAIPEPGNCNASLTTNEREELARLRQENHRLWTEKEANSKP
jgi:integrase